MELVSQYVSVTFATLLGYWIRLCRLAMLRGQRVPNDRFVPFRTRTWSSDLPWSRQFYEAVQSTKWNQAAGEHPPIHWNGVLNMKDPFSLASYPLLVFDVRPATIIEIGAFTGGSAIWLADMMQIQGIDGRVYSFDLEVDRIKASHPRVQFRWANSHQLSTFDADWLASLPHPWLVIEDAHQNVYNLLRFFNTMMRAGDYLVLEDTLYRPKYKAMRRFILEQEDQFMVDTRYTDLFGYNVTWHPNSYFKKMY